jgi:hypothetical protein
LKSPSFIYAAFRAEKPEKMAKSASSSESRAKSTRKPGRQTGADDQTLTLQHPVGTARRNLTNYQWTVQALDSGGKVLGTAQPVAKFPP